MSHASRRRSGRRHATWVAMFAALSMLAAPTALAVTYTRTPLPKYDPNPVTGWPGFMPKALPDFDTDNWPDSDSCQVALNAAINTVANMITDIPAATTDAEHAAQNAIDAAIKANLDALAALRPICLAKAPGGGSAPSGTAGNPPNATTAGTVASIDPHSQLRTTRGARRLLYAVLTLVCPGYSTCRARGSVLIETVSRLPGARVLPGGDFAGTRVTLGRGVFNLTPGASTRVRVRLNRTATRLLRRGPVDVRVTVRSTPAAGGAVTRRRTMSLRPSNR
jgi:hypothetical protein